jgi:hypothetical protein
MYVAQNPKRLVWQTADMMPFMGFGQDTAADAIAAQLPSYAYPEPEITWPQRIVAAGIGFGIMTLAAYLGARWALKSR